MIPPAMTRRTASPGKPRASGDDPRPEPLPLGNYTVNPARAGMILTLDTPAAEVGGKPRASGDDPRAPRWPLGSGG